MFPPLPSLLSSALLTGRARLHCRVPAALNGFPWPLSNPARGLPPDPWWTVFVPHIDGDFRLALRPSSKDVHLIQVCLHPPNSIYIPHPKNGLRGQGGQQWSAALNMWDLRGWSDSVFRVSFFLIYKMGLTIALEVSGGFSQGLNTFWLSALYRIWPL